MENIKKLLEQQDSYFITSADESDSDSDYLCNWNAISDSEDVFFATNFSDVKRLNLANSKKRNGEIKMPTRRPDPNVYNRNALLARENRRKKKVYVETIEKELLQARKINHALTKALKRQLKIAQRLEKEKKYFETLVRNRSDLDFTNNPVKVDYSLCSTSSSEEYINNGMSDILNCGTSSLQDAEVPSIKFGSSIDGNVTSIENSLCGTSSYGLCTFPDFTDLVNYTDISLPTTSTTYYDILCEKDCGVDSFIPSNLTVLQTKYNIQNVHDGHSYITLPKIITPESLAENEPIDVERDSHIGVFWSTYNWNRDCRTPPLQLLSEESS